MTVAVEPIGPIVLAAVTAYLVGSIPWAYTVVRLVTGEDITAHGTGNVGAMNVRRTTGSWGWFTVVMVADALKGAVPVAITKYLALGTVVRPVGVLMAEGARIDASLLPMAAVAGAVLGHNYSAMMAVVKRRCGRTGKGLATGAGALLSYDWRYFAVVVIAGVLTIAATRYMMAGQVVGALCLPASALVLRSPDVAFAIVMGLVVYAAHHRRFVGLLRGREPRLYIHDRGGPRG